MEIGASRPGRMVAAGAGTGGLLLLVLGLLEAVILFIKRPEPWTADLLSRLAWSPVLYGLIGLGLGALIGLVVGLVLAVTRASVPRDAEPTAVWACVLPALLALYWIDAVNRIHPGGSREPAGPALDGLALLAALAVTAFLWRRTVRMRATIRARGRWTVALLLVLWAPFYAILAEPSLEYTRVTAPPEPGAHAPPSAPNVLLVMLDTVRTDCLGCYGQRESPTPNIDRFAAAGVLFEQAVTPEAKTRPAFCSMMTGLYPRTHGVDTNEKTLDDAFLTLPEIFRARGYHTAAFTAAGVLSGYFGTAQGFDYYAESPQPWWHLRTDSAIRRIFASVTRRGNGLLGVRAWKVNARAVRWLRMHRDGPFFAFVHYFDPHAPYSPPRQYDLAARDGLADLPRPYEVSVGFAPGFVMPADFLRKEWLRYRGEIAYVDACFGELLGALDDIGVSERTIVILVGDHGESFERRTYFTHGWRVYDTEVRVPLIIRDPRLPGGRRVPDQVRLIDLYRTVLSVAGLEPAAPCQGADLTARLAAEDADAVDLPAFCQTDLEGRWPHLSRASLGLRLPPWKYIESPEIDLVELYQLEHDPAETANVVEVFPEIAAGMAGALSRWTTETQRLEVEGDEMPPGALEVLRALGYLQ